MHKHFRIFAGATVLSLLSIFLALIPEDTFAASISIQCNGRGTAGWSTCPSTIEISGDGNPTNIREGSLNNIRVDVSGGVGDSTWALETPDGANWVLFSSISGSFGRTDIRITARRNTVLGQSRAGTIRLYERETNTSVNLSVRQASGECQSGERCFMNSDYSEVSSESSFAISGAGGSRSFQVFSNYTGSIDASTPLRLWSNDTGDSVCPGMSVSGRTVTAQQNNSGAMRTCLLAIGDTAAIHQVYYITQGATNDPENPFDPNAPLDQNDDGNTATQFDCQAGKMGWALCPIMEGLDSALGDVYGFIEQHFLQVNVEFYNRDSEIYRYWGVFRNIANILFVIFFMVVILSQVTSIGISNYGIKKMLPEIIMAAILINISFFIAQAMVDLSNIIGVSIRDLLGGLVGETDWSAVEANGGNSFIGVVTAGAIAGLVGVTVTTFLAQGIFGLIMAFLLVLLAAAVALLMMFVILVVRQVGVILLIVLAPLAFAARILPNTQSLFKKWWSAFVSLLVVYPMCSLVIGLGAAAASIIGSQAAGGASPDTAVSLASIFTAITSGNFSYFAEVQRIGLVQGVWIAAAVLATVAPYFAVISLSKGALNGLGKLGGMITGKVAGAGSGLNKLGRTGAAAGQRKYDQSAGRMARVEAAKSKAQEKAIAKASTNKGVMKQLAKKTESDYRAEQTKDAMAMANLGQYDDDHSGSKENRRLMAISAKRAAEIGVDPTTGLATREPISEAERRMQNAAKNARNMNDAKAAKEAAEGFEGRPAADVYGEVYDEGNKGFSAATSQIEAEQAIKHMESKGEWKKSAAMQDAYMAKWGKDDSRGRGRLGQILQSKDSKEQSFARNAYGKALSEKGYSGTFEQFMKNQDENGVHNGKGISDAINSPKYRNSYGSMHGEAIAELVKHDTDGSLRKKIAQDMNLQSVGQMGDNIEAFIGDGTAGTGAELFSHVAEDYVAAGSNAATLGYTSKAKQAIGVAGRVGGGSADADNAPPPITEPAINFQTTTDSSYTDTATGARVEDIRTVDLSGQEVLSQITRDYTPTTGEVDGSKQYYQNAVDRLSTEQLGQIIQHDNRVNAGGKVTDQHYSQLRSFAQKSLAGRGETAGAREAQNHKTNPTK